MWLSWPTMSAELAGCVNPTWRCHGSITPTADGHGECNCYFRLVIYRVDIVILHWSLSRLLTYPCWTEYNLSDVCYLFPLSLSLYLFPIFPSAEQRRLRHLRSIAARNIVNKNGSPLLDTYFTLHLCIRDRISRGQCSHNTASPPNLHKLLRGVG